MSRLLSCFLVLLTLGHLSSCTSSGPGNTGNDPAQRRGQKLKFFNQKYLDFAPSIAADGNRIVFLSGRKDGLRAFWYDATAAKPKAEALTSGKFGVERQALIAPDGLHVALVASTSKKTRILVAVPGGAAAPVAAVLGDIRIVEARLAWSTDSALIAAAVSYYSGDGMESHQGLWLIDAASAEATRVRSLASGRLLAPLWIPGGTGYQLVVQKVDVKTSLVALEQFSFASSASVGDSVELFSGLDMAESTDTVATQEGVLFTQRIVPAGSKRGANGMDLKSQPAVRPWAVDESVHAYKYDGFEVLALSASAAGDVLGWAEYRVIKCEDKEDSWGLAVTLRYDGNRHDVLAIGPSSFKTMESTDDICADTLADDSAGVVDLTVRDLVVSANSTAAAWSYAFVSTAGGDTEVWLAKKSEAGVEFTSVSNNRK